MSTNSGSHVPSSIDCKDHQFPHPFHSPSGYDGYSQYSHAESPVTLAELRMMRLSWAIRSKKGWQEKMKNPKILKRWKEEAEEQQEGLYIEQKMTTNMINYVFSELEAHANLTDPETGIQYACNDRVFCSHTLISDELLGELQKGVAVLEGVPEDKKDWHPGSNNQVLDLVHPSLYCLVFGRTLIYSRRDNLTNIAKPSTKGNKHTSQQYAWIPSDFFVSPEGEVRLESSYINNLHKSNTTLYSVIPKILGRFIPMFERVLGAIAREREQPMAHFVPSGRLRGDGTGCVWDDEPPYDEEAEENDFEDYPGGTYSERQMNFYRSQKLDLPNAPKEYQGALEKSFQVVNLRGRTLQIIVKLANIHLTPERPEYPGGNWHVEGMLNEHIVSTGIYYYDSENTTDSQLEFRAAVREPQYHHQGDGFCMETLFGIDRDDSLIQERGVVTTTPGLSLAFPNIYQHCVSPFQLADPTKPGHRKILAFFLVDPNYRIASATNILPQQIQWMYEFMRDNSDDGVKGTRLAQLPVELREMIVDNMDGLMAWEEACEFRNGLMKERSNFVATYEEQAREATFNMCEH